MTKMTNHGADLLDLSAQPGAEFLPEQILDSLHEAMLAFDLNGNVRYLNAAARSQIARGQIPRGDELAGEVFLHLEGNSAPEVIHGVINFLTADGFQRVIEYAASPIPASEDSVVGFAVRLHSHGQRSAALRQLLYDASHDELTGLVNRRELIKRLRRLLARQKSSGRHAIFFMDLNNFKRLNDTCGHCAGDEALRQVASLLREQIRKRDTLGRLGGDEFVLLMEHCPESKAVEMAHRITRAVGDFTFSWTGKRFPLGISVGMVPLLDERGDVEDLLAEAEAACYLAKRSNECSVVVSGQSPGRQVPSLKGSVAANL